MISPKNLKEVLSGSQDTNEGEYFFKTHVNLEGYVKRIMLIGLRLGGVQYDNSVKIVDSTYITTANLIEKVLWLIDKSGTRQTEVISKLKNKYPDFFVLKDIVTKFSAIYRNRLAHGTIEKLHDQELIDLLCHSNKSFFLAFENLLLLEHGHSAFDKPGDWGAARGSAEKIEDTVKKLKLGSLVKEPMPSDDVKSKLEATQYVLP